MRFGWPLGIACLLVLGCATAQRETAGGPPTIDVSGTWSGNYVGTNGSFPLRMTLQQTAANVTGDAVITGDGWTILSYSGPVRGNVSGNALTYTYQGGGGNVIVDASEMRGTTSAGSRLLMRRE
jgi:hypothetical protein